MENLSEWLNLNISYHTATAKAETESIQII